MKKFISFVLMLTMLTTGFTFVHASNANAQGDAVFYRELIVENFSGNIVPDGWYVSGSSDIVSWADGMLAFTSTSDKNADVYYNLPDTITSGIVTVQYKVKADAVNKLSVSLQDSDWESAGGTQTNLPSFLADGNIAREKSDGNIFSEDLATENTWVTVGVRIDLNIKEATQTLISEDNKVLYADTFQWSRWLQKRNETDAADSLAKIKSIGFEAYAGAGTGETKNYVDDVKIVHIPNRTNELIFDYDFENIESVADLYSYGINFWDHNSNECFEIKEGDASRGKTMVHNSGNTMFAFMLPSRDGKAGYSGVTQIDFKIKPNTAETHQLIQLGGGLNRMELSTDNLALRINEGNFYIGNKSGGELYTVPITVNEWYDVSIMINAPMKNYTVAIGKDGEEIIRKGGLPLTLNSYDPGYLLFKNWDTAYCEIDDIKAMEIAEYKVFSEDFESYETLSDGTNALTDMAKSGYKNYSVAGNPGGELVTENENKVWSFNGNNGDLGYKFPSVVTSSGKVRMELSMKFGADTIAMAELMDSDTVYGTMAIQACYNRLVTYTSGAGTEELVLVNEYDPNKWYDFNIIVDYDAKTYSVGVSADGKAISRRKLPLMDIDKTAELKNLHRIGFRHWGGSAVYVDDISISVISQLSEADKVIAQEDFTGVTQENDIQRSWSSYYSESYPLDYAVSDEAHGNSALLVSEAKDSGIKKYVFAKDGVLKWSYDLKTNGADVMVNAVTGNNKEVSLGFFGGTGDIYHTALGTVADYYMCSVNPDEWISVETLMDIENKLFTYSIKDEGGNLIHKQTVSGFKDMTNTTEDVDNVIQYIGLRNWSADKEVYVDNFNLEYYDNTKVLEAVSDCDIDNSKDNIVYSADINLAEGEAVSLNYGDIELLKLDDGEMNLVGNVNGVYTSGKYHVDVTFNFAQQNTRIDVTLPDGGVVRRGSSSLVTDKLSATKIVFKATSDLCTIENQTVSYPEADVRAYTMPAAPVKTGFDTKAYNLTTSFNVDAKTTRSFAWTAVKDFDNMAVVYAKAEDFADTSKRTTVTGIKENPVEEANQTVYYYKADISGLEPGTEYTYMIGDLTDNEWGSTYTFETEGTNETDFRFIMLSDTHAYGWDDGFSFAKTALDAARTAAPDAKFMLHLGDITEQGTDDGLWNLFFDAMKGTTETIPMFATVGNHDLWAEGGYSAEKEIGDLLFDLHLNHPDNGGSSALENVTSESFTTSHVQNLVENFDESTYSFDYGNVHVVCLTSGSYKLFEDDQKLLAAQREWVENDLKNSDATWKIAFVHEGVYHRSDASWNLNALQDVLEDNGVDILFSGHEHIVKRTHPMKNGEIATKQNIDYIDKGVGTIYSTIGSTIYTKDILRKSIEEFASVVEQERAQATYTVVDVSEGELCVTIKSIDGLEIDKFTILNDGSYSAVKNVTVGDRPLALSDLETGAEATLLFNHRNADDLNKEYTVFAAYYGENDNLTDIQKIADGKATKEIEEISYAYTVPQKQNISKIKFFVWYSDSNPVPAGRAYTIDK